MEKKSVNKLVEPAKGPSAEKPETSSNSDEILLWIDSYDDIFSDFDSRPYYQRALSQDFIHEAKAASVDKPLVGTKMRFIIPANKRDPGSEKRIKHRLSEHFSKHFYMAKKEKRRVVNAGIMFLVFGLMSMFSGAMISLKFGDSGVFFYFLVILLEPAGWFLCWEGLNQLVFDTKHHTPDVDFYRKMANCEIHFSSS
jgi:hypothetical protein